MSKVANLFRFSESLAGVTLVALANGAPDVVSAFAAGAKADSGVLVSMGALFGAGMFTTCIVLCSCIFMSPKQKIKTQKDVLTRDCAFYLVGAAYFLICGLIGKIYWYMAAGVLVIYACFIGFVLNYEIKFRRAENTRKFIEAEQINARASSSLLYHDGHVPH